MNPSLCTLILVKPLFKLAGLTNPRSLTSTAELTFIAHAEELGDIGRFSIVLQDLHAYREATTAVNERASPDWTI